MAVYQNPFGRGYFEIDLFFLIQMYFFLLNYSVNSNLVHVLFCEYRSRCYMDVMR